VRGVPSVQPRRPGIRFAGFEHQARPGSAPVIHIHHGAHVLCPRMMLDEDSCAQPPCFFSVVDKKDQGILWSGKRFVRARDFQYSRRAGTVIRSTRTRRYRIVMRGEQNRWAGGITVKARDYIFDRGTIAILVAREASLDLRVVADVGELIHDTPADDFIVCASGRMRHTIADKAVQNFARALG
jgi:hypothetical protein